MTEFQTDKAQRRNLLGEEVLEYALNFMRCFSTWIFINSLSTPEPQFRGPRVVMVMFSRPVLSFVVRVVKLPVTLLINGTDNFKKNIICGLSSGVEVTICTIGVVYMFLCSFEIATARYIFWVVSSALTIWYSVQQSTSNDNPQRSRVEPIILAIILAFSAALCLVDMNKPCISLFAIVLFMLSTPLANSVLGISSHINQSTKPLSIAVFANTCIMCLIKGMFTADRNVEEFMYLPDMAVVVFCAEFILQILFAKNRPLFTPSHL